MSFKNKFPREKRIAKLACARLEAASFDYRMRVTRVKC